MFLIKLKIWLLRELKTGEFRVRDGQTLILTGVIQDDVKELFTKWPILGDIPLIGQFFRSTTNTREKRELVIVVTPKSSMMIKVALWLWLSAFDSRC